MDGDVLINTGRTKYRDEMETWLLNYSIKLIILTDGYNESIENAAYFSELYGAPIAMSRYDIPLIRDNSCRKKYITSISGKIAELTAGKKKFVAAEPFEPQILAENGVRLCDMGVEAVLNTAKIITLDGHTRGSIGILDGNDLYCGGALCNQGGRIGWPYSCESPAAAKRTMKKIAELMPERIFFTHGVPVMRGSKAYESFMNSVYIPSERVK